MPINLPDWLEQTFCDGPPPEPLRRYRIEATVRIPDITPDQLCTRAQAEQYATEHVVGQLMSNLAGLDGSADWEITAMTVEEVEE